MQIRATVMAPLLRIAISLCLIFSVMLMLEKVMMGAVSLFAKIFQRRPEKMYKSEPLKGDEEIGTSAYPMVLVQIPMYNEKQVMFCYIQLLCLLSIFFVRIDWCKICIAICRCTNSQLELHVDFCGLPKESQSKCLTIRLILKSG